MFWDVRRPEHTIVVELKHERYQKLMVEVADPDAVVNMINGVLAGASA